MIKYLWFIKLLKFLNKNYNEFFNIDFLLKFSYVRNQICYFLKKIIIMKEFLNCYKKYFFEYNKIYFVITNIVLLKEIFVMTFDFFVRN